MRIFLPHNCTELQGYVCCICAFTSVPLAYEPSVPIAMACVSFLTQELATELLRKRSEDPAWWAHMQPHWDSLPDRSQIYNRHMFLPRHLPLLQDPSLVRLPALEGYPQTCSWPLVSFPCILTTVPLDIPKRKSGINLRHGQQEANRMDSLAPMPASAIGVSVMADSDGQVRSRWLM